jgi:hypothetical protein
MIFGKGHRRGHRDATMAGSLAIRSEPERESGSPPSSRGMTETLRFRCFLIWINDAFPLWARLRAKLGGKP